MSLFSEDLIENEEDIQLYALMEEIRNNQIFINPPTGKLFYLELDV